MLSQETHQDIICFLIALANVAAHFNIRLVITYLMIDAAPEEAKAIQSVFPSTVILMCWFHVKKNVREPKHGGKAEFKPVYDELLKDCNYLHYSMSKEIFESRKLEVLTKWSAPREDGKLFKALQIFKEYFIKQWLEPPLNNWQLFNTPPGFATTQNPEESFNKQVKLIFTEFERLTPLGACNTMHKICLHYSENCTIFAIVREKCNKTISLAKECSPNDFVQVDANSVWYKKKYYTYLEPRYCSCGWFLEFATCKHQVASCIIYNHIDSHDLKFTVAKARGRPKKSKGALTK